MKLLDVIKFEGENDYVVWKHPEEDFRINSQLIVDESQEAIFYNGGEAKDTFGPGTHALSTKNFPFIDTLIAKFTGGVSAFHCKVYFINKMDFTNIKWGTPDKITIIEPTEQVPFKLGAGGTLSYRIEDSRRFILKMVGTRASFGQDEFVQRMREVLKMKIGDFLANAISELKIGIFELDRHLSEFSEKIQADVAPLFEEYGIELNDFTLSRFVLPEDDPNYIRMLKLRGDRANDKFEKSTEIEIKKMDVEAAKDINAIENDIRRQDAAAQADVLETVELRRAEVEAKKKILDAQAMQAKRQMEGYSYQEEQGYKLAQTFAEKQSGSSSMMDLGMGLGTMLGVGSTVANYVGGSVEQVLSATKAPEKMQPKAAALTCANCGQELPQNAKFCLGCGEKVLVLKEGEVICPSCKKATPKGKFCMECGAPLSKRCPSCGMEVPEGGKFCLECGTKL